MKIGAVSDLHPVPPHKGEGTLAPPLLSKNPDVRYQRSRSKVPLPLVGRR
jgi:hypothetical protein